MTDVSLMVDYLLSFLGIFVTSFMLLIMVQNTTTIRVDPPPLRKLPSLSVIIPAYNEEENISQTIESVVNSDYPKDKIQVILVDDGSNDGTLSVMHAYAKRYPKLVQVISKKNGGKGTALNAGLKEAKGELISTLDSDSYVVPDAFRKMTGFFSDANVAAVTSVLKVANPKNFLQEMQRIEYLVTVFSRRLLSYLNAVNVTPGPLSMFRAEVFRKVGGYDENNILEDQEMALRIQGHNYRIESAMDSVVYTNTPDSFKALTRQRIRWNRGGVRNILKHHYLVGREYGDFGMVIMPLSIISIIATFLVLLLAVWELFSGNTIWSVIGTYGIRGLLIGVSPVHVLGAILVASSILWAYLGVSQHAGERISALKLLTYTLLYAPIITLFWIATAVKEIKGEKLSW